MNELEYSDFLKEETDLEREAGLILEHHGIKGQRWGVRRTPEQLGYKKKGRGISGAISAAKKRIAKTKKVAAKKKAAKAKAKAEKQEKSDEEIRKELLDSTDPAFIYKYRKLLDSKELQDRIDRISKEQRIKDLIPDPDAKRKKQIKKGEETLKSLASMADSVGKIYDTYNKVAGGNKKSSDGTKKKNSGNQNDQSKNDNSKQTRKEKKDAAEKSKAANEFFSDPGVQAMLALGMVTPSNRQDLRKRAQEENERRKKSWSSNT